MKLDYSTILKCINFIGKKLSWLFTTMHSNQPLCTVHSGLSGCQKVQKKCICEKKRTERICYLERVHSRRFFHWPMHLTRKYLNKNRHFIDQVITKGCKKPASFRVMIFTLCCSDFIKYCKFGRTCEILVS